jgi:hypothetical protein
MLPPYHRKKLSLPPESMLPNKGGKSVFDLLYRKLGPSVRHVWADTCFGALLAPPLLASPLSSLLVASWLPPLWLGVQVLASHDSAAAGEAAAHTAAFILFRPAIAETMKRMSMVITLTGRLANLSAIAVLCSADSTRFARNGLVPSEMPSLGN